MKVFVAGATGALGGGRPGIHDVVDDPTRCGSGSGAGERAGCQAAAACAALARPAPAGEAAAVMMTGVRSASNEKAKRELGRRPCYASWRQGFAQGLG